VADVSGGQNTARLPLTNDLADAVQRIQRLLSPAGPLGWTRSLLLRAGAGTLVLTPAVLALAPAVVALALGRIPV
jgi:hypothetical protein